MSEVAVLEEHKENRGGRRPGSNPHDSFSSSYGRVFVFEVGRRRARIIAAGKAMPGKPCDDLISAPLGAARTLSKKGFQQTMTRP
jgi:hypothetical protein